MRLVRLLAILATAKSVAASVWARFHNGERCRCFVVPIVLYDGTHPPLRPRLHRGSRHQCVYR